MPDNIGPRSLAEKFLRICMAILGGVIMLVLAIELMKTIWWILVIVAVSIISIAGIVQWWRYRNTWN